MKRNRYVITLLLMLSVLTMSLLFGCTSKSSSTTVLERKYDILKVTQIESQGVSWHVYQLRLQLDAGAKFTIDLILDNGDKVDCWYKVDKPTTNASLDFEVKAGTSTIYAAAAGSTSDRFSFTASQVYGTSYRLIFFNDLSDEDSKETIFTEIIYPVKAPNEDSIFIPLSVD